MDSIKLAAACYNKGLLSKEATIEVLKTRDRLIKEAISLRMGSMFANKAAKGAEKGEGFLGRLKGSLGMGNVEKAGVGTKNAPEPMEWSQTIGNLVKLLGAGAALQGGAMGVGAIIKHRKDKDLQGQIESSYDKMMDVQPALKGVDPGMVSRHFGVLARYAPSLAADPMVAGSWVRHSVSQNYIEPTAIRMLSDTQTSIDRAHEERSLLKPGQFAKGLGIAQTAMG